MKYLNPIVFTVFFFLQLFVLFNINIPGAVPAPIWILMMVFASLAFAAAMTKVLDVMCYVFNRERVDRTFDTMFALATIMAATGCYASIFGLAIYYDPTAVVWYLGLILTVFLFLLIPCISIIQVTLKRFTEKRAERMRRHQDNSLFQSRG